MDKIVGGSTQSSSTTSVRLVDITTVGGPGLTNRWARGGDKSLRVVRRNDDNCDASKQKTPTASNVLDKIVGGSTPSSSTTSEMQLFAIIWGDGFSGAIQGIGSTMLQAMLHVPQIMALLLI